MVLVLPTLFHVALLATVAPFTPTNAGGSTYVFTITGAWGEPACQEDNAQVFGLEEILAVFEDEATCDDGISFTHAFTTGQIAITETGLAAFVYGGGYAFDGEDRKSTRLNSSHKPNSYAVFCLKKKNKSYIIKVIASILLKQQQQLPIS